MLTSCLSVCLRREPMERASGTVPSLRDSLWSCGSKESSSTSPPWIWRGEFSLPVSFFFFFLKHLTNLQGVSLETSQQLRDTRVQLHLSSSTACFLFPWPFSRLEKNQRKTNSQTLERRFEVSRSSHFLPSSRRATCYFSDYWWSSAIFLTCWFQDLESLTEPAHVVPPWVI